MTKRITLVTGGAGAIGSTLRFGIIGIFRNLHSFGRKNELGNDFDITRF